MSIFKKLKKIIENLFCCNKKEEIKKVFEFKNYLWNIDRLDEYNGDNNLIKQFNWKFNNRIVKYPLLITDKPNKFVEDTHYYVSLATYYWPNPDTEDGLPYIVKDCERNPECDLYDTPKLSQLVTKMRVLALGYYMTRNEEYYKIFKEQLEAWFINPETYMYPEIEYCQIGPGTNNNKGINTLDMYILIEVFESIALVNSITPFYDNIIYNLQEWIKKHISFLENSKQGAFEDKLGNNHSIAYDVYLIYLYIMCYGEVNENIIKRLKGRIKKQILETGEQPLELKRGNGMHYSIYNLEHLVDSIKILENVNKKYEDEYIKLINSGFEFLYQFSTKTDFEDNGYAESKDWDKVMDYLDREAGRINFAKYDFTKEAEFIIL